MNGTYGKTIGRLCLIAVVALVALCLAGDAAAGKKKTTLTVSGKIKGAEMRRGKIVAVYIADGERGEFIVSRGTDVAKVLVKQVGATIRATGYVGDAQREPHFDKYIDILEYEILVAADPSPNGS